VVNQKRRAGEPLLLAQIRDDHRHIGQQRVASLGRQAGRNGCLAGQPVLPSDPGAQQQVRFPRPTLQNLAVFDLQRPGDHGRGVSKHSIQVVLTQGQLAQLRNRLLLPRADAQHLFHSGAFDKIGSLSCVEVQPAQVLFGRPMHGPEMRRQHTQRLAVPAHEGSGLHGAEAARTRNRTEWGKLWVSLDVLDDDPLAETQRPATG
jgi:hypothetical protein